MYLELKAFAAHRDEDVNIAQSHLPAGCCFCVCVCVVREKSRMCMRDAQDKAGKR